MLSSSQGPLQCRRFPRSLGQLPPRYERYWGTEFWAFVNEALHAGSTILDVGGGRRPTIPPEERPGSVRYVGLDASRAELEVAPSGSYDETVVGNIERFVPQLANRFDLIVAWQVLEHVRDLQRTAEACYQYAKPGGCMVACLSGRNAVFALANRILPSAIGGRLVAALMRRPVETVFPAYYDRCDRRGLRQAFSEWDALEVIALWRGADYFARLPMIQCFYVAYENWAIRRGWDTLATHYVVAARKGAGGP